MTARHLARTQMPPYSEVFAVPGFAALFVAGALSTWGDYIARLTVAAVVYDRTSSPLATATTLAVSLLPSIFGRTLLGPLADRLPYKYVLVCSHLSRALMVLVLIALVTAEAPLAALLVALFVLETLGGPAAAANQVLLTDLFTDRRVYVRALGMTALSEQLNQAVGLVLGALIVSGLGAVRGLVADLLTFVVSAVVVLVVVKVRPVVGDSSPGLRGFFDDLGAAIAHIARHPVLSRLLLLSLVSAVGVAAPEAVAIPYAGGAGLGGLLMAAPIAGAALGVVVVSRWEPRVSNDRIILLALAMPVPLLFTVVGLSTPVVFVLWFISGTLQAFMVPLQSTFTLVTPSDRRGTIFGLAGALSVTAAGLSYLLAGWFSELATPGAAVTMCAVICLGAVVLLAARWPRRVLDEAVQAAYRE
ncbi:MFS transporter [Lapillicoccus sp.]|uniref:MFS transporter n=1 Tax=Lapillicoccus sp. TaxID=1909287 RepID=UPI0032650F50